MEGLIAQSLRKRFRSRVVVNRVTLDIHPGEVVGLLGPNGAGKTTSFYMIVGLLRPDDGRIFLEGQEVTDLPMYKRCRLGMGYLPQESSVFRKLTVEENLLAILETLDLSHGERMERLEELLAELELTALARHKAYTLSGGERRRLEITRALVTNPRYLLLDEPFTGIDPIAIGDIQEIVARLKERGIGVLITDHNVRETLAITDRAYILHDGRILASGTAIELANKTDRGLASYVYTRDLAKGLAVAEAIESGMVGLNRGFISDPAAPFGGVKQSGIGREGAHDGLMEFLETKYIATNW